MVNTLAQAISRFYDRVEIFWKKPHTERRIGFALLWIYLLALLAVELERQGLYPQWLPGPPHSHFYSIQLAFTLILGLEVIGLIFVIPYSLSRSMAKQLEILTLILLRNAFKELSLLPEPVNISMTDLGSVTNIAISGLGALLVFLCLGVYRKIMRKHNILRNRDRMNAYILAKKILAIFLLLIFICIGIYDIYLYTEGISAEFFETVYTALIFADIAMVLIAQRYMPSYFAVFRNSGFVIGTLMMRLSLSAPPLLCAAIAVFAAVYVLALTWGTNLFMPEQQE